MMIFPGKVDFNCYLSTYSPEFDNNPDAFGSTIWFSVIFSNRYSVAPALAKLLYKFYVNDSKI